METVIALIGRTNVGKSTLFNKLICNRNDALVSNYASLTRDRKYGYIISNNTKKIILIDTPGLNNKKTEKDSLYIEILKQVILSIKQSNLIFFVVNAREKVINQDFEIFKLLKKYQKNIFLLVNKIEGLNVDVLKNEFCILGIKNTFYISATNGIGIKFLLNQIFLLLNISNKNSEKSKNNFNLMYSITHKKKMCINSLEKIIKIAIIGKPNVGKSTLINTLLNQERMVTHDQPGTTRDSIFHLIKHDKKKYIFFDTAGVKKKKNINQKIEKLSIYKTLNTLKLVNIALLVIDAENEISDQDLYLFHCIKNYSCPIVIVLNKCDLISNKKRIEIIHSRKLKFMNYVKYHFISAKKKTGINKLFQLIEQAFYHSTRKFKTSQITDILQLAIKNHKPPIYNKHQIKIKYAHIGRYNPITIIIHGNKLENLSLNYKKYLTNFFQSKLNIVGSSIILYFKTNRNPFYHKN